MRATLAAAMVVVALGLAPPDMVPTSEREAGQENPIRPVVVAGARLDRDEGAGPFTPAGPHSSSPERLLAWARGRFALAGMELPDVVVSFHDDTTRCDGAEGIFRGREDRRRVQVCIPDLGTFASNLQRQRTLVHELAHAWDHANLTDADRTRVLELLDADEWHADHLSWQERGAERFAETIVWGLYDQIRRPTLIDAECTDLHAAFQMITGHGALGPIEPRCAVGTIASWTPTGGRSNSS